LHARWRSLHAMRRSALFCRACVVTPATLGLLLAKNQRFLPVGRRDGAGLCWVQTDAPVDDKGAAAKDAAGDFFRLLFTQHRLTARTAAAGTYVLHASARQHQRLLPHCSYYLQRLNDAACAGVARTPT